MNIVKTFFLLIIGFSIAVSATAQEATKKTEKPVLAAPDKTTAPALIPIKANDGQAPAKISNADQAIEETKPQFLKDGERPPKSISTLATEIKDVKDPPVPLVDQHSKITTTPPVVKPKTKTPAVQQTGIEDQK